MASLPENDITIIYYTANVIPEGFAKKVREQLVKASGGIPIISVSKKPINFGDNIDIGDAPPSHIGIYEQALIGAKVATTKYIALAEDDVLYSPEHFKHRSSRGKFAYNLGTWSIFTWTEPMFTHKINGRINLCNLICERELFIEAMEERFAKHPDESKIRLGVWAEPGKYERQLGVTIRETETFITNPPNIMFSHETALSFQNLGTRKKVGEFRATALPYWGHVQTIKEMYQ